MEHHHMLVWHLELIECDCIAFPKNNSGRDVMLDAPGFIDQKQLDELQLKLDIKEK